MPKVFTWLHRGFARPSVTPFLRDGVHFSCNFLLVTMYEWCDDLFRSAMLILPTLLLGLLHCNSFMYIYVRSTLPFRHAACHSLSFDENNIAFFKFCFVVCLPPAVLTALLLLLPLVLNETIDNKPEHLDAVHGLLRVSLVKRPQVPSHNHRSSCRVIAYTNSS